MPAVPEVCPSAAVLLPHSGWAFVAMNRPQELPCFTAKDVAALSAALPPDAGRTHVPALAHCFRCLRTLPLLVLAQLLRPCIFPRPYW